MPPGGRVNCVILTDQTRSLDYRSRHGRFIAVAPEPVLDAVLTRVAAILGLVA